MKVLFRVDASTDIGTGHVMRCLTLADALRERGARSTFVCRAHPGHLGEIIRARGHALHLLEAGVAPGERDGPAHAAWLGASQAEDAAACAAVAGALGPDWLIVDHYALDARWEVVLRPMAGRIMVIDDLADRTHDCDLLLDQNLGRNAGDYAGRVPEGVPVLAGPDFALLRPEFAARRTDSLARRGAGGRARSILIALGGVDKANFTARSLEALAGAGLPDDASVTVVLGATAPWEDEVRTIAGRLPWPVEVLTYTDRMGELMVAADLAIGAAGASTWERCCLGLPTAMWVVAENQKMVASAVVDAGAAALLDARSGDPAGTLGRLLADTSGLDEMSRRAFRLVDGLGTERVVRSMLPADPHPG